MSQILTIERIHKIVDNKTVPKKMIDDFNNHAIKCYSAMDHYFSVYYGRPLVKEGQMEIEPREIRPFVKLIREYGYHVEFSQGAWSTERIFVYIDDSWKEQREEDSHEKRKHWWHFW